MTYDVIGLCRDQPTPDVVIAAMHEAGPDLRVDTVEATKLIQLYRDDGRLMMTTEGARLVQVRGEVRRILGLDEDPEPVWWVETHAPGADADAVEVARIFTRALVAQTGGFMWSTR